MRAALVGAGAWGSSHARVLSGMGALAAVCDPDEHRREAASIAYSVPGRASVGELIEGGGFEAAVVAAPAGAHLEAGRALLEAGVHVLVEKPFGAGAAAGRELAAAAEGSGAVLACGYIERFNPGIEAAVAEARSGGRGEAVNMEAWRVNRIPGRVRDVGIVWDTSVHDICTAMWLFGGPPETVYARSSSRSGGREDHAVLVLGFPGGRTAVLTADWSVAVRRREMRVYCSESILSLDMMTQRLEAGGGPPAPGFERAEPLALELRDFLGAAASGGRPRVGAAEAVAVAEVAEAALRSSRTGEAEGLGA